MNGFTFQHSSTVLWDVNSKEILQRLHGHEGTVLSVDVCAQDGAIATCGLDKTIKIYRRRATAVNGQAEGGAELKEEQDVKDSESTKERTAIGGGGVNGTSQDVHDQQTTKEDITMEEG